jgi:multicomponent K+:H+ antiporter subunit F
MLNLALSAAIPLVLAAMLLNLLRLVKGPTVEDRVLALDTLTINAIGLILLAGLKLASRAYFEAALILAMMGFLGTVALARFRQSGSVMDP